MHAHNEFQLCLKFLCSVNNSMKPMLLGDQCRVTVYSGETCRWRVVWESIQNTKNLLDNYIWFISPKQKIAVNTEFYSKQRDTRAQHASTHKLGTCPTTPNYYCIASTQRNQQSYLSQNADILTFDVNRQCGL